MMFADALERVAPLYQIPNQDLVGEVLVPAMRVSDEVKIEAGFFSSRCLAQVAPGLAAFINDTKGVLHVLASPEISEDDREAIRGGLRSPQDVLEETMVKLFEEARLSDSAVERHAVDTLAYLNQYQGGMCISGRLTMTERTTRDLISPLGPNWVGTDSAV